MDEQPGPASALDTSAHRGVVTLAHLMSTAGVNNPADVVLIRHTFGTGGLSSPGALADPNYPSAGAFRPWASRARAVSGFSLDYRRTNPHQAQRQKGRSIVPTTWRRARHRAQ